MVHHEPAIHDFTIACLLAYGIDKSHRQVGKRKLSMFEQAKLERTMFESFEPVFDTLFNDFAVRMAAGRIASTRARLIMQ
jgi:hypothetical protein